MALRTVCMILVGIIAVGTQGALFPLVKQCCSLGVNFATQTDGDCRNLPLDDFNLDYNDDDRMSCLAVIEVCCYETRSNQSCETGKAHAIRHGRCDNLQGDRSCAPLEMECCGCCKLGQVAGKEGLACEMSVLDSNFGDLCSATFSDCCNLMTSNDTTGSETGGHGEGNGNNQGNGDGGNQSGGNGNSESLCARFTNQLCDQICVDVVDETGQDSFRCECERGYELSAEGGRNCVPVNSEAGACATQNPCDQICKDSGLQIECSCNAGYSLDSDSTSCKDIDECAVQGTCNVRQLCVNTVGSFRCEDSGSLGTCAKGMKFNTRTRQCEDIDECTIQANVCAADKRCVNTVGSFRCENMDTCGDGHRLNPRNNRCEDINECTSGSAICSYSQICINTVGSYRCEDGAVNTGSCGKGLVLNSVSNRCEDINECTSGNHNCNRNNMDCLNTIGSFLCRCFRGYQFKVETQDCQDINECVRRQDSCTEGQQCVNTVGSYYCRRTVSCGTGYTLDEQSQGCVDVDECRIGTDNCGDSYECKNIPGSFRCEIKERDCPLGSRLNYRTGICERVTCPRGMRANSEFNCVDIDECSEGTPCAANQRCENTRGAFRCVNTLSCYEGFQPNADATFCEDIDECVAGTHSCDTTSSPPQTCVNERGSYKCKCPQGYRLNPTNKKCEDDDECTRFGNRVCSVHARCLNVAGSYRCVCKEGFESRDNGRTCSDKNECLTPRLCQHSCINTYGSYQCRCDPGYKLASDKRSCRDINECAANFTTPLAPICIGLCHNTPGSFQCTCPQGYTMGASGRQCQDIDECLTYQSRCSGENQVCVNTRGGYRCNDIQCPPQFFMPANGRQRGSIRCQRLSYFCRDGDEECKTAPLSYTYNFLSFPSRVRIPADLFTMRSRSSQRFEFDLRLLSATGTAKNTDFKLIKVNSQTAMVRLISRLDGPQQVELQLDMNIYYPTDVQRYIGRAVAKIIIYVTKDPWEQLPGHA